MTKPYDLWNNADGVPDQFIKNKISIVELLFRAIEEHVKPVVAGDGSGWSSFIPPWRREGEARSKQTSASARDVLDHAIRELNQRFRQSGMPFHYHSGIIQFARDSLTEERVSEPCWELLRDQKWSNVDRDLKEAVDHADRNHPNATLHAAKALESALKITSDERGLTTGFEKGASNFIDNLASKRGGNFIATWEAEILRTFFRDVRNPQGHGAGSQQPPTMTDYQVGWAIEFSMAWIKSLLRRL